MKIDTGHIEAHEKLTGRLFLRPAGDGGYIDLGNVVDYKDATEVQARTHMRAANGARFVDREQVDTVHQKWEFTCTETSDFLNKLLSLATSSSTVTQGAQSAPAVEVTVEDVVLGRTYDLGYTALVTPTVKVGGSSLPAGDYTLDINNGLISFAQEPTTLAEGDDVDLTFGVAARDHLSYGGNTEVLFRGSARIEERNQFSKEPLRVITCEVVIMIATRPEQTGEFGKVVVRVTATNAPTITRRHAA